MSFPSPIFMPGGKGLMVGGKFVVDAAACCCGGVVVPADCCDACPEGKIRKLFAYFSLSGISDCPYPVLYTVGCSGFTYFGYAVGTGFAGFNDSYYVEWIDGVTTGPVTLLTLSDVIKCYGPSGDLTEIRDVSLQVNRVYCDGGVPKIELQWVCTNIRQVGGATEYGVPVFCFSAPGSIPIRSINPSGPDCTLNSCAELSCENSQTGGAFTPGNGVNFPATATDISMYFFAGTVCATGYFLSECVDDPGGGGEEGP